MPHNNTLYYNFFDSGQNVNEIKHFDSTLYSVLPDSKLSTQQKNTQVHNHIIII